MVDCQVTCAILDGPDADRRIDKLGGNFTPTPVALDTMIGWIDKGHTFWTEVGGYRADIIVKQHPQSGRRYLTTEGDGYPPNNLLKLPRCP